MKGIYEVLINIGTFTHPTFLRYHVLQITFDGEYMLGYYTCPGGTGHAPRSGAFKLSEIHKMERIA